MANPAVPAQASPGNVIAWTSATIGVVSGLIAGQVGLDHAKGVYEAATGSTAGFNDYLTVGKAFWDGLPIAAAVAVTVGLLAYGKYLNPGMWRYGPGMVALMAASAGGAVDADHLQAYEIAQRSGATDSAGVLMVFVQVYGLAASLLAAIAGAGVGYAVALGIKANET